MYKIGQFSILCRTPIKTLRYYDEINLLKPEKVDECTNYRLYTTNQLIQIHYINSLRQIGFSIKDIKSIMSGHDVGLILNSKKSELQKELIEINNKLSRNRLRKRNRRYRIQKDRKHKSSQRHA